LTDNTFRSSSSFINLCAAFFKESISVGSKYNAALPPTSGNDPPLLSNVGHPHENDSKTGMPKPSSSCSYTSDQNLNTKIT
jgi:hypothetical protein